MRTREDLYLFMVIDSLRYTTLRGDGGRQTAYPAKLDAAITPTESSYGVNHWRTLCVQAKTNKVACGINGFLPTPSGRVPSIYSSAIFLWGLRSSNSGIY